MNYQAIVNDPGSTTKAFKILTSNYSLVVLFSDFEGDVFKRVIVIKLDDIPVMVAISQTQISNEIFLDILRNSQTTPIGVKLFDPKSGIRRGAMIVKQIKPTDIADKAVAGYVGGLGTVGNLYLRKSKFKYEQQSMDLDEYVLPGLRLIIDKYNLRNKGKVCSEF